MLIMTTSTAQDAGMWRFPMGTTSTMCTTVTSIDRTTVTTTNASHPATPCTKVMTTSTVTAVAMWPCRMTTMSTTCTTGAATPRTANTTTSTDAGVGQEDVSQRFATVRLHGHTGHERVGHREQHGAGNVIGRPDTPGRVAGRDLLELVPLAFCAKRILGSSVDDPR